MDEEKVYMIHQEGIEAFRMYGFQHGGGFIVPPYTKGTLEYMFWKMGWDMEKEANEVRITA